MIFPELNGYKRIHFIGVGGVHMSCLAELLLTNGYEVTGSDRRRSPITDELVKKGINVVIGHSADNIQDGVDLVVKNAAVHGDNIEIVESGKRGVPVMDRGKLLGIIMKAWKYPVCISGVHGKTTVTSMIAEILMTAGTDPTVVNGGYLESIGGYLRMGHSDYFTAEACEYHDSFLDFFPFIGVILNIDADHLDYFNGINAIYDSFARFAGLIPENGALVINGEIPHIERITNGLKCRIITYNGADLSFSGLSHDEKGMSVFSAVYHGANLGEIRLKAFGAHNAYNALAAVGACLALGIPFSAIKAGLEGYTGVNRRFQYKGELNGGGVFDDYAHHPTEIRTTLESAAKAYSGSVWCVFQPHTKSRTQALFNEFIKSFDAAQTIIFIDIFEPAGREEHEIEISSNDLCEAVKKRGLNALYFSDWESCERYIKSDFHSKMLITMGAGDIIELCERLI